MNPIMEKIQAYLVFELHGPETRLHQFLTRVFPPKSSEGKIGAYDRYLAIAAWFAARKRSELLSTSHITATTIPGGRMFMGLPFNVDKLKCADLGHIILTGQLDGHNSETYRIEHYIFVSAKYTDTYREAMHVIHNDARHIYQRYIFALIYPYVKQRYPDHAVDKALEYASGQVLKLGRYECGVAARG